jgi:deoxyribonuclease IV
MGSMLIGAQLSTSGGLERALTRAQAIGAGCVQVFLSAPRQWRDPRHGREQAEAFAAAARAAGIGPNFAHAIYLINLASTDALLHARSVRALAAAYDLAGACQVAGLVVHVGSSKGQSLAEAERQVVRGLAMVLETTERVPILLENSAGAGSALGARLDQLGRLLDDLGRDARLGICLDTAHAFASGYDVRSRDGVRRLVCELAERVGAERLRLVHGNDSTSGLGSALDRHTNIGEGQIGEPGFARLLAEPVLSAVPWVLEVPGVDGKGPDARNIQTLRRLAGERERGAA